MANNYSTRGFYSTFNKLQLLFLYGGDHRSKDNNVAFKCLVGTKLICRSQYLEDFKSLKHFFLKLLD